jgi:hypothetical protein
VLERERSLWIPDNVGKFQLLGQAPTKDVVLGAWRDLDRSEALLELIDNSVDVWLRRRDNYPDKAYSELNIFIGINNDLNQLTYEDNASGVPVDKLENLVVPGHSDTEPLSKTIGSYKTGGKKAVFRLASAAQITTRYWSPSDNSDQAVSVQLDEKWINDPIEYKFPYAPLKDKSAIEKGHTRYVLQLREEPLAGGAWFQDPDKVEKILSEIRRAYSLLMIRNPAIQIFFQDRKNPIEPRDSYAFSGTATDGVDIRPQQIVFQTKMPFKSETYKVDIELVVGIRRTTGAGDGGPPGIDLYGNDRMFVSSDQELFEDLLPGGASKRLFRGFVNIRGPNVFIPWDTHKRHLNVDRDIMNVLRKNILIREVIKNWKKVLLEISGSEVKKLIDTALPKFNDKRAKDIYIPHRATVSLDPSQKRGVALPSDVFIPRVKAPKTKSSAMTVSFKVTLDEARTLAVKYGVSGELTSRGTMAELGAEIKSDVLGRARRSGGR